MKKFTDIHKEAMLKSKINLKELKEKSYILFDIKKKITKKKYKKILQLLFSYLGG